METSSHGPHVLYVAWGFPPMAGGGTYRTLATANALARAGCRVTVLTADRAGFAGLAEVDPALEESIDPSIDVVRVPFDSPGSNWDIRTWPRERVMAPMRWLEAFRSAASAEFPDAPFSSWLRPMLAAAEEVHARVPVRLTMGSANPNVVLAAGHHLYERYGVPHVIDHRDAWRLNCYLGIEAHTEDPRVAELESRYMESASAVWFVNEPIRAWHQELYPRAAHKMRVVENGYDPEFAPLPVVGRTRTGPPHFVYVGSIGTRVPVEEFIDGWVHAVTTRPELAGATADVYGPLAPAGGRVELARDAGAYGLNFRGPLAKAEVAKVYAAADGLLLLLGAGRYVTSGKVYEYLASGLPIISLHEPGNGATDILERYPLWYPAADMTVDGVADALAAAATGIVEATTEAREAAVEFGRAYERGRQLEEPVADLVRLASREALR